MSKTIFLSGLLFIIGSILPFSSFAQSGDVYEFTAPIFIQGLPSADENGTNFILDRNSSILLSRSLSGLTTKSQLQTIIIAPKKNGNPLSSKIQLGTWRNISEASLLKLYSGYLDKTPISGRYVITRPLPYNDSVQMNIGVQFSKNFLPYEGGERFIYNLQYASGTVVSLPIGIPKKLKMITLQRTEKHIPISISTSIFSPCLPEICGVYRVDGIRLDGTNFDALALYKKAPVGLEMFSLPSDTVKLIVYTRKL